VGFIHQQQPGFTGEGAANGRRCFLGRREGCGSAAARNLADPPWAGRRPKRVCVGVDEAFGSEELQVGWHNSATAVW